MIQHWPLASDTSEGIKVWIGRIIYTLYAYADIGLGCQYNSLIRKDRPAERIEVDCTVEHAIYEGWFPADRIEHGHKHILFLRFTEGMKADCIPMYDNWEDICRADWQYIFCDYVTYEMKRQGTSQLAQKGDYGKQGYRANKLG